MLLQVLHQSSHSRSLLSDGYINTVDRFSCLVETLLIDDGVNSNSCFARLSVTDNQLTLSASDGNHRVHRLDTGLQGLLHRLTVNHTRSLSVERHFEGVGEVNIPLTVDCLSQWIDDTAQHIVVHPD